MPQPSLAAGAASADDLAICQATFNEGSRTFLAASFLMPRAIRRDAAALYAFCRMADDAIDRNADKQAALERLGDRLERIFDGRPLPVPSDRAFAAVVARHAIPRALPDALMEGFAWDAGGRHYETLPELFDYAARVAGSVGAMMTIIMGRRASATLARATELGVAMQLTNIARDVGEDARAGRLYLPRSWLREERIDADEWLARPAFSPGIGRCVARLLSVADRLYERAGAGVADLPWACRAGILAARTLYAEIGREVERRGLDSVSGRAVVSPARKAAAAAVAAFRSAARPTCTTAECLAGTRFLVDAVLRQPLPARMIAPAPRWWRLDQQFVQVIDLFERLERRDAPREAEAP